MINQIYCLALNVSSYFRVSFSLRKRNEEEKNEHSPIQNNNRNKVHNISIQHSLIFCVLKEIEQFKIKNMIKFKEYSEEKVFLKSIEILLIYIMELLLMGLKRTEAE